MESLEPDNLIQHTVGGERVRRPTPPQDIQSASMSTNRPASRGFSLNVTLRLRPFAFAIGVTPLSETDRFLGHVT